jgi:hypothetical protein
VWTVSKINVHWWDDGRGGQVVEDQDHVGFIRLVSDWYEPTALEPRAAWVIDWLPEGGRLMQRCLVELHAEPVTDHAEVERLTLRAKDVIALGPPDVPAPFGFATAGLESASARLMNEARKHDESAVVGMNVVVLELAGWLRTLDYLLALVWDTVLDAAEREAASVRVDQFLASPGAATGLLAQERQQRQTDSQPYDDWSIALLAEHAYIPRAELHGWRWLAGKLLHHGPLSAVERQQWRAGEAPRWKWRTAEDIFSPSRHEERPRQRAQYSLTLAGKDVVGSLNFFMPLRAAESVFLPLLP